MSTEKIMPTKRWQQRCQTLIGREPDGTFEQCRSQRVKLPRADRCPRHIRKAELSRIKHAMDIAYDTRRSMDRWARDRR